MATIKDLMRGRTEEEINALLSGIRISSPGFDMQEPMQQPMPQNFVQNSRTGATYYDLGPSRQAGPAVDYSSPIEVAGHGKGYRVKGDPFTVIMEDSRIVRLGGDEAGDRRRLLQDLDLQAARQKLEGGALDQQIKLAELQNGKKATIPAGYRTTATGELEPIPGGPADFKQQGKFNQDVASLSATESALNSLAEKANQIKAHPGLDAATGWQTLFPTMPGSKAADAESQLDTLKSKVAFGTLQAMRDASKTGGALGAVSEKELKLLESNIDALGTAQSPEQFRKSLEAIVKYAEEAKGRARRAFNLSHEGGKPGSSGKSPHRITNDADYNALPKGAIYITPNGETRTKR